MASILFPSHDELMSVAFDALDEAYILLHEALDLLANSTLETSYTAPSLINTIAYTSFLMTMVEMFFIPWMIGSGVILYWAYKAAKRISLKLQAWMASSFHEGNPHRQTPSEGSHSTESLSERESLPSSTSSRTNSKLPTVHEHSNASTTSSSSTAHEKRIVRAAKFRGAFKTFTNGVLWLVEKKKLSSLPSLPSTNDAKFVGKFCAAVLHPDNVADVVEAWEEAFEIPLPLMATLEDMKHNCQSHSAAEQMVQLVKWANTCSHCFDGELLPVAGTQGDWTWNFNVLKDGKLNCPYPGSADAFIRLVFKIMEMKEFS